MSICEAINVQELLAPKIQAIYNLNFKHRTDAPDFKKYKRGVTEIVIYPNAIDYIKADKVVQIKWEVIDPNYKVSNITLSEYSKVDEISEFLQAYVWGTE